MKAKQVIPILIAVQFASTTGLRGQGYVGFSNTPMAPVIDGRTGEPATGSSEITVGLYWSFDSNPSFDNFSLAATAPILNLGIFNNGGLPVGIERTNPGDVVYLQVRAWSGGYASYEEMITLASSSEVAGVSRVFGPVTLAEAGSPFPSLTINGGFEGFCISWLGYTQNGTCIPEPATWLLMTLGAFSGWVFLRRKK